MKSDCYFFVVLLFTLLPWFTQAQTEKFEPQADMLAIPSNKAKVLLKVGQKAYHQGIVHGSVGMSTLVKVQDEEVLKFVDKHFAYHRVQVRGMTGGDKATKTYIFEALKKGKTKIKVKKVLTGEILEQYTIKIKVKR